MSDFEPGEAGAPRHQLAQVNVGRLRAPVDSPVVAEFVAALDPVNRLADASPGFVWRLSAEESGMVAAEPDGDPLVLVNLSVWESYEALHDYVYRSGHGPFLRRRSLWFERTAGPSTALWWVPAGARPTVPEALARFEHLRNHGPTPQAFSLLSQFDPEGRPIARRRVPG